MQPSIPRYDMQDLRSDVAAQFVSPRRVVSELNLWKGDHVLDYIAGAGYFVPHLRAAVGDSGRVYAHNPHKAHHESLMRDTVARGQREVMPILHALDDELLIDTGTLDAVVLANVLSREVISVERVLSEVARIVRREGKLCVVDWYSREESKPALIELLADFNFIPKRELSREAVGTYHYGIIFTKI